MRWHDNIIRRVEKKDPVFNQPYKSMNMSPISFIPKGCSSFKGTHSL